MPSSSTSQSPSRLSVIIPCFNYEKYVGEAIDSVLEQEASVPIELIVVDDCSSDGSRAVISSYGDRVIRVFHEANAGHGGAFNSGFAHATGDLVMFLDADDFLLPGAVETILNQYDPAIGMYHFHLRLTDPQGKLGDLHPPEQKTLASGDVSHRIRFHGGYDSTVTSGLVFTREALEKVLPMDAEAFRQGADGYLSATVPLHVRTGSYEDAIAGYRLHGDNHSMFAGQLAGRARWVIEHDMERYRVIREHADRLGLERADSFAQHDLAHLEQRICSLIGDPEHHPFPEDDLDVLCRQALEALPEHASRRVRLGQTVWWHTIASAPRPVSRKLLTLKNVPASRPKSLARLARWVRQRTGIVLR